MRITPFTFWEKWYGCICIIVVVMLINVVIMHDIAWVCDQSSTNNQKAYYTHANPEIQLAVNFLVKTEHFPSPPLSAATPLFSASIAKFVDFVTVPLDSLLLQIRLTIAFILFYAPVFSLICIGIVLLTFKFGTYLPENHLRSQITGDEITTRRNESRQDHEKPLQVTNITAVHHAEQYFTIYQKSIGTSHKITETYWPPDNTDQEPLSTLADQPESSKPHTITHQLILKEYPVAIEALLQVYLENHVQKAAQSGVIYHYLLANFKDENTLIDIAKLEQSIGNLLSLAFQAAGAGRSVYVTAEQELDQLHINITMSATVKKLRQTIAEAQKNQPEEQSASHFDFVRSFVELLNGDFSIGAVGNKESRISFNLPLVSTDETNLLVQEDPMVDTASPMNLPTSLKDNFILVVDDNFDMHEFMRILVHPYCNCLAARNGLEAIEIIQRQPVDLIISDLMMPEMNGFQLLQKLKSSDQYRTIPFIMLTGLFLESTKLHALTLGVDDYLIKPFNPKELLARISNALLRRKDWVHWQKNELDTHTNRSQPADKVSTTALLSEKTAFQQVSSKDTMWLKEVEIIIRKELTNDHFRLPDLAEHFHLSNSQFARRIKKTTGLTPKKYQQEIVLQAARELLEEGTYNKVTAVAYSVGFYNIGRFSQMYEERFGKRPSAYFPKKAG